MCSNIYASVLYLRDYDLSAFNTHAIASCLQHWLMELPEPVIPEEFYNECIKNANKQEQTLIIVDQLPEVQLVPLKSSS